MTLQTKYNKDITIKASIDAGLVKAWQFYTLPEHIKHWNQASPDWHTTHVTNDMRMGGRFLWRMEAKDGSFGFDFCGTYTEVVLNQRIGYTLDDARKVTIEFAGNANDMYIILTFEPETENPIELQRNGWQAILDSFKHYAETH